MPGLTTSPVANDPSATSARILLRCTIPVGFEAYARLSLGLEGDEMRRREFITLVGGAMVALPLAALAQKVGRTYRLGCLSPHPRDIQFNVRLFDNLRLAGFIEGQN